MAAPFGRNDARGSKYLLSNVWAAVCLAAVCFAAYLLGSRSGGKAPLAEAGLMADPRVLDFGEVWEDADFHWKLPIRNTTTQEIKVLDFAVSCTCVSLKPRSFTLAPGEVKELELSLDLTRRKRLPQGQEVFQALLLPKIKGSIARTQGWTLHGRVRQLLKFNPAVAVFGDLIRGQSAPDVLINVESVLPLRSLDKKGKESNACVQVVQKGSRKFELTVTPPSTLPAGPFHLEIPIQPTGQDGKLLPAKKLIVVGIMHEDVEPMPSPLVFGALPIGETVKETVVLKSITGKPFKVEEWQSLSYGLRVELVEMGDKMEASFAVSQNGTTAGNQWTEARFRVHVGNQPSQEIPLKIFYHGQEKAPGKK